MTSKAYDSIKARAPEDIHLNIKAILVFHVGADNAISKEELSRRMFGKYTTSTDRQIRDAVAELVIYFDEPIVTNTVTGGFYYAGTPDEIDENIADNLARAEQLKLRAEGLRSTQGAGQAVPARVRGDCSAGEVAVISSLTNSVVCGNINPVTELGVLSFTDNASHNLIVLCGLKATLRTPELCDRIPARRVALWL